MVIENPIPERAQKDGSNDDNNGIYMSIYKVAFLYQGKVYEVYAETVRQGELYGFVELEGLIFEHTSELLVDPSEEKLRDEFKGVQRTLIPIHAVLRIDEVMKHEKRPGKIMDVDKDSNVTPFPSGLYTPGTDPTKK